MAARIASEATTYAINHTKHTTTYTILTLAMPGASRPAAHIATSVLHMESTTATHNAAVVEHPLENTTVLVLDAPRGQLALVPCACVV